MEQSFSLRMSLAVLIVAASVFFVVFGAYFQKARESVYDDAVEQAYAKKELLAAYKRFIEKLPVTERRVFLLRYWYLDSIGEIALKYGFSESKVKSMLHRTRQKLNRCLVEEGLL